MTCRAATEDILQWWCFYHTQVWLFLRHQRSWCRTERGGGCLGGQKKTEGGKVQATLWARLHQCTSTLITLSLSYIQSDPPLSCVFICLLSPHLTCSPLCLQNDDGPDVRAGSGDILLVHATETDRKGMVQTTEHETHIHPCICHV